jgi:type IV pilus assembly protein PilC
MENLSQTGSFEFLGSSLAGVALYLFAALLPSCGLLYLMYFLLTLPMRRKERARLFLDLLEMGMKEGRTPELAIENAASSRDRSLGVRFHLLAAHLEQGLSLTQALEKVPRLLPPQIIAMLKTGARIGDLAKVFPACRHFLRDGVSHVRGAMNYLILMAFIATPVGIFVALFLRLKVLPAFEQVFAGMVPEGKLPAFTQLIFADSGFFMMIQILMLLSLWLALFAYVGGPRVRGWLKPLLLGRELISPWRSRRLKRDFSAMLAVLLDAGVPESEAVQLAGTSTASPTMVTRANRVCALLKQGIKLPEALRGLDVSGELQWRISNALRRGHSFLNALAGWHDALDAKAFQLEQSAAQITTTSLVLINGLIVGAVVCAIFLALINLVNEAVLW